MHTVEHKVEEEKDGSVLRFTLGCIIVFLLCGWVLLDKYSNPPKLTGRGERVALVIPVAYFYCVENLGAWKYGLKPKTK